MTMDNETQARIRPRFHRLAEQVADHLRHRILVGELADGSLLPKEAELRAEYPVSKPSIREAMRILEAEGLVTVRRGKHGGAVVHRPSPANVAYTLSLVLASERVAVTDVAAALKELEPACAAFCALRPDRATEVVPELRRLHEEATAELDDLVGITTASRRYHEALVQLCGNFTLSTMTGALEALWSAHESSWASRVSDHGQIPLEERTRVLRDHERLIDAIEAGDAALARRLAAEHLEESQQYPGDVGLVDPDLFRDQQS